MRTDRQTYVTKLTVVFRNFANASKNVFGCGVCVFRVFNYLAHS